MYKIISKRNSWIERSITFEVDGKLETISAPATNASFDDLEKQIAEKYGEDAKAKAKPSASDSPKEESEPTSAEKATASKGTKKKSAQSSDKGETKAE